MSTGEPSTGEPRTAFMVVGSARSGTTLVQRLACELDGVRMPPETHFFSQFARGLVSRRRFPLEEGELTEELGRFAALESSRGLELDRDALVASMGAKCESPFAMFDALVRRLAGPASMWGEKTPDHLLWWRPLSRAAPWMRFVAVVREPRAVVASALAMPWRDDPRVPSWGDQVHLAFASRWALFQQQALSMQSELGPERCLTLRYEDVVADPERARARLAEFLGRSAAAGPGPSHGEPSRQDMVLGWEDWKRDALGPVSTDRVAKWRDSLGPRAALEVATVCRRQMRSFGYPEAPGAARAALVRTGLGPRANARLFEYGRANRGYLKEIEAVSL